MKNLIFQLTEQNEWKIYVCVRRNVNNTTDTLHLWYYEHFPKEEHVIFH